MASHSGILAWGISWTEELDGCQKCRRPMFYPWVENIPWSRKWLPTTVFLPKEFHGQRSLAGYSPWSHKELDTTELLTHTHVLYGKWHLSSVFLEPYNNNQTQSRVDYIEKNYSNRENIPITIYKPIKIKQKDNFPFLRGQRIRTSKNVEIEQKQTDSIVIKMI